MRAVYSLCESLCLSHSEETPGMFSDKRRSARYQLHARSQDTRSPFSIIPHSLFSVLWLLWFNLARPSLHREERPCLWFLGRAGWYEHGGSVELQHLNHIRNVETLQTGKSCWCDLQQISCFLQAMQYSWPAYKKGVVGLLGNSQCSMKVIKIIKIIYQQSCEHPRPNSNLGSLSAFGNVQSSEKEVCPLSTVSLAGHDDKSSRPKFLENRPVNWCV